MGGPDLSVVKGHRFHAGDGQTERAAYRVDLPPLLHRDGAQALARLRVRALREPAGLIGSLSFRNEKEDSPGFNGNSSF